MTGYSRQAVEDLKDDYTDVLKRYHALREHMRVVDWAPAKDSTGLYMHVALPTSWVRELVELLEADDGSC